MTLFRQLLLGASLLFLLVLAGVEAIHLGNARLYLQQQLESHSQDGATSIALWLATIHPFEDRALIETAVNASFDRGYYEDIRVVSVRGEILAARTLPAAQGQVPAWFVRLFPLHPPSAESLISAGWRQLGRVVVTSHPHFAYLQLWNTAVQTVGLLAVGYALSLLLLRAFLGNILRPLAEVERTAQAIGERNFAAVVVRPATRELARVADAINSLSAKVRRFVADEAERAEALQAQAYRDAVVTACYNRRGLEHQWQGLARDRHDLFSGGLVLLELDGFKEYNLRHGFAAGDDLLTAVAAAMRRVGVGKATICARLGGAGFALVAVNVAVSAAAVLVADICAAVETALEEQLPGDEVQFFCGATYFEHRMPGLGELLAAADQALARARELGPGLFEFVPLQREGCSRGSRDWQREIVSAIDEDRLALYSQTIFALPDRSPFQSEIVTRIVDRDGTRIPAAQFMPMAARHRLMPRLDGRVLEMLIARLEAGADLAPSIAVNLAAQTLADPAARHRLLEALRRRQDLAGRLVFEMTEFGVVQDPARNRDFVAELRRLGCRFAIDHFGLHRHSLKQLDYYLPHYVKLAPVYTKDLAHNRDNLFYVASLIRIARTLEIGVIAQEVESEALIPFLTELGFAGFQGFAAERPRPVG